MGSIFLPPSVCKLQDILATHDLDAFLVGGAVRNFLLTGEWGRDYDFELHGQWQNLPQAMAKLLEQSECAGAQYTTLPFQVHRISFKEIDMECAVARKETFLPGRSDHKNFKAEFIPHYQFQQSFRRRDFTINAIAYDHRKGEWIDPFGGRADLEKRMLRPCSPDFPRDPVRFLRAMRFREIASMEFSPELQSFLRAMDLRKLSGHYFFGGAL